MITSNLNVDLIQLKALVIKEYREAFRDKRALMVALMMAILAPVGIMVMSKIMIEKMVDEPPIYVKFIGAEHAPKLIKHFADKNLLDLADVPKDEKSTWEQRNIAIEIPEDYAADMAEGKPIKLHLQADFTDKAVQPPVRRINNAVREFSLSIGYKRLLLRGVDIRLLNPVKLVEQDTAKPDATFMLISMMLGIYLMLAAFMSGLSVAIDSSAGERERNVLEMLLCQPVSTMKIVLAKLISASTVAVIGVLLILILTSVSVGFVDLTKIGATFSLDLSTAAVLLLLLLPICFFASACQLFVAFQTKSFKEAQSTVGMLIGIPAFIPFVVSMMDDRPQWLNWLPIAGQSMIIENIFKGVDVDWLAVFATSAVTIAITIALVLALAKKLKSEKVVMALS
ncbi:MULTISPECIES: ABC transporter permease [Colwellia]|uniref:Protein NatB n=1 Tax=Colwellia psychrerythraea (strain 34H / ATCC BAA-681) TaxID=167879 RepID=Q488P0_COLP3|nr:MULTISPECIES: ABC transporter permease [Colwellia]AAZ25475.1 protein NatB [Colwellia psychrerythraea 34H]PKH86354.1 ABC transporter permease [Colwellia sp. Bg11-28]